MTKTLLQQALEYAEYGFYILPCRHRDEGKYFNKKIQKFVPLLPKRPLIKRGLLSATRDSNQIKEWWKKYPQAMIGMNCGMSNRFVIDVDRHKVDGMTYFLTLGISDEGCGHVTTPSNGLHIYFSGQGKTRTEENLGVDTRGIGGYVLLPDSYILEKDGTKKYYRTLDNIFTEPKAVTEDVLRKLELIRDEKPKKEYVSNLTADEELKKIEVLLYKLPFKIADNYLDWTRVGMLLHKFGEEGKLLWEKWTEETYFSVNPNSTRIGTFDYRWNTFRDCEINIGTLYYWLKEDENK